MIRVAALRRNSTVVALAGTLFGSSACGARTDSAGPTAVSPDLSAPGARDCGRRAAVALQVLGSGGPIPDDARASSGYVVWVDGKSRLLVDVGGGVFQRFAEAGATLEDLDAIAVTHLHVDHAADLIALLFGGYFATRERPLPIVGPSGNDAFPPMDEHVRGLLSGPFRYLDGYLKGAPGWFGLPVTVVDAERQSVEAIALESDVALSAVGVQHGRIPALGYVVEVRGKKIAFAGDQSGDNPAFVKMAEGADVLVMHHPIPESAHNLRHLHAPPSQIGAAAAETAAKKLVLGHHMRRALAELDHALDLIRERYTGPVVVANDLECVSVE